MGVYLGSNAVSVYAGGILQKPEEEKTVTAGTSPIEVQPSEGYSLGKVTVNPTPSQPKEVTAGTSDVNVFPDSDYRLSKVTVHPTPTETKSVTPITEDLIVAPIEGNHLSQVTVQGDANFLEENIAEGITIWGKTGTHKGQIDIANGTSASYVSYDSDIEAGNFVEITEKLKDGFNLAKMTLSLPSKTSIPSGYDYDKKVWVSSYRQIDDNHMLLVVREDFDSDSGTSKNYVYMALVEVTKEGFVLLSSTSSVLVNVDTSSISYYNNKYYICMLCKDQYLNYFSSNTTKQNSYIRIIPITISNNTINMSSMISHQVGTGIRFNGYSFNSGGKYLGGYVYNTQTDNYANDTIYRFIIDITSTSTSNYYYSNGTFGDGIPRYIIIGMIEDKYLIVNHDNNSMCYLATISTSGYTIVQNFSFDAPTYFQNNDKWLYRSGKNIIKYTFSGYNYSTESLTIPTDAYYINSYSIGDDNTLYTVESFKNSNDKYDYYRSVYKIDWDNNTISLFSQRKQFASDQTNYYPSMYDVACHLLVKNNSSNEYYYTDLSGDIIPCIMLSSSKISGVTKSLCTSTTAGEVIILQTS